MPRPRDPRPEPSPPVPGRDDSPANLQRIRDKLNAEFDRLHQTYLRLEIEGENRSCDWRADPTRNPD